MADPITPKPGAAPAAGGPTAADPTISPAGGTEAGKGKPAAPPPGTDHDGDGRMGGDAAARKVAFIVVQEGGGFGGLGTFHDMKVGDADDAVAAGFLATPTAAQLAARKVPFLLTEHSDALGAEGQFIDLTEAEAEEHLASGLVVRPTDDQLARRRTSPSG